MGAANWAISNDKVEASRASVVMVPPDVEWRIEPSYLSRLLSEAECRQLSKKLGFDLIPTNKP